MVNTEIQKRKEEREVKTVLKAEEFLRTVGEILSEFVPMAESEGETILHPVIVKNEKGSIRLCFSGKHDMHGLMQEGRLHVIRDKDGKKKKLDIVVSDMPSKSFYDLNLALAAVNSASRVYRRSNLPRRTPSKAQGFKSP